MTASAITRRSLAGLVLATTALAVEHRTAQAAMLPLPTERPILTVSGTIRNTNKDATAQFDRAMLEGLGMTGFETRTPWYDKPARFEGPLMQALLTYVGADGSRVVALALNDYSTEIPLSDFSRYGAILALKRDATYLTVRDKGPLFIVYPYDTDPELRQQKYYGRSAWQVAQLVIK